MEQLTIGIPLQYPEQNGNQIHIGEHTFELKKGYGPDIIILSPEEEYPVSTQDLFKDLLHLNSFRDSDELLATRTPH